MASILLKIPSIYYYKEIHKGNCTEFLSTTNCLGNKLYIDVLLGYSHISTYILVGFLKVFY